MTAPAQVPAVAPVPAATTTVQANHIAVLDGWRAVSIIFVLVGHWMPIPRILQANHMIAASGMALFFTLSGFLITRLLLKDQRIVPFLIRRLFRILPLAWAAMAVLLIWHGASSETALRNLLFTSNLPPAALMSGGAHLWSLCVEMHFYLGVALLVALTGRRGLYLLPLFCAGFTALRIIDGEVISIVTWHRVDEILVGACLALVLNKFPVESFKEKINPWACVGAGFMLLAAAHPESGPLQYLRPYFAAATVGLSLYALPELLRWALCSKPAKYVAQTSYALYVWHGPLGHTFLGGEESSKLVQYALRPVLLAVTFLAAHISTFYFEARFTAWGKRIANGIGNKP
ncbi:acyltransferase family protein [Erythrobacter sp. W53]|uniref:acyltransferase family protein n=1 Tax=Erythrobacteraceae TaxID=335929 RepID=UPI0036D2E3F8